MTIEFWPKKPRKPGPVRPPRPLRQRMPKLPIPAGKAHQKLSQAIICGDHKLASWLDQAAKRNLVTGDPRVVQELRDRLDSVMAPQYVVVTQESNGAAATR